MEDKDLQILIKAARAGGEVLRKYFGQTLNIVEKSIIADYQTKADLESEQSILKILKNEFSEYNILSEEEGQTNNNSDYTLVIDPLDGTNNFVLGIPHFSVSIALLYKNEAVAGVVYQPMINSIYSAIRSEGAFLNGEKINVNNVTDSKKLTIAYGCNYKTDKNYFSKMMTALYNTGCRRTMNNWSAAFESCMLASGKIESYVSDGMELHDFAAGKLIAIESGAEIIDFKGEKEVDYTNSYFIMSNSNEVNKYVLTAVQSLQ